MATASKVIMRDDPDLDEFKIKYTKYFRGYFERFETPWEKWQTPSTGSLLHWKLKVKDNSNIPKKEELDVILPVLSIDLEKVEDPPKDKVQVTWIGHATILVQFDGITILTDPVFTNYCGPKVIPGIPLGYKRFRDAACQVEDIPHIDVVMVSHDHFDHLDSQSAKEIIEKFPDARWFVGKNGRDLCKKADAKNVYDLLWWEEVTLEVNGKEFRFACVPTQHWCRRSATDMNSRLWCSWIVKGPTKSFYFAGDTGYYEKLFKKIGEKYGPFSLSALPIGCIEPRNVLKYQHVDPAEAAKIHYDVKSEQSISMHWGTFVMTNEFYLDPPRLLEKAMGKDGDKFISMNHGERWIVGSQRERPAFMETEVGEDAVNTCPDESAKQEDNVNDDGLESGVDGDVQKKENQAREFEEEALIGAGDSGGKEDKDDGADHRSGEKS